MGNSHSSNKKKHHQADATTTTTASSNMSSSTDIQEVSLLKRRPGCTGMFWRPDPTGKTSLANNNNWPRDGAKLRGTVVEVNGERWLLATEVQQKGQNWVAAPAGAAMPFEYNNHYYLE